MKKLEDKILKKVFVFETKKTTSEMVSKIAVFVILGFLIFIFAAVIIDILNEQKMFDLFELFQENFEVVRRYFFEVFYTFYQGIPKIILYILLFLVLILITLIYLFIKNFAYLKNRIKSIIKFWFK